MAVVRGAEVAKKLAEELRREVGRLRGRGISPCAAIVQAGENPSCAAYGKGAAKKLESVGIGVERRAFPEDISQEAFLEELRRLDSAPEIHGILLLRPLPPQLDEKEISSAISPLKDLDGMNPVNLYRVMAGEETAFPPCTPEAVMEILDYLGIDLAGKKVAIVGASMVVGLPLFLMLLHRGATCVQCHILTKDLAKECRDAEIVVAAAGKRGLIGPGHIAPGAVVVDVGINVAEDGRLYGDVLFDEVEPLAGHITPVPGGVGSVTSTILAAHVVKAAKIQNE